MGLELDESGASAGPGVRHCSRASATDRDYDEPAPHGLAGLESSRNRPAGPYEEALAQSWNVAIELENWRESSEPEITRFAISGRTGSAGRRRRPVVFALGVGPGLGVAPSRALAWGDREWPVCCSTRISSRTLSPPAEHVVLDAETSPPELPAGKSWDLPTDLTLARQALTASGVEMDPRRIDVFQLGGLLCRLLTGRIDHRLFRSPSSRGLIPPALRPVVDRALGHDAEARRRLPRFSALLAEAESGAVQNWEQETPALGIAELP